MTTRSASLKVSRRGFLQTSTGASVASGGLMLSFTVLSNRAQAAGTLYTPDAWVHVADDNTSTNTNTNTILSARSETGQGVSTSMPMLVAETLNVDLKKTKVAIALVGKAYRNALFGGVQLAGGST